ncbi:hypothetical protein H4S08_001622 [Coemansia sp. RSA 1365]|nr:hypothetical protein H4S08_001622 [Coemansia sp. RSA 1365]
MSSSNAGQRAKDGTSAAAGDSTEVNSYIASLQLERNNTKVGHINPLQRRRTLMKEARDPQTDQKALEQEIKQVERLASLLGRRATRFDGKRGVPKVNHDLDATLVGFFDDHDDNERLGDILLSGGHRTQQTQAGGDSSADVADPRLVEKSIHAPPSALIAQQQSETCRHTADPFEEIEEMDVAESLTGSAEYLPIDTYKSEDVMISGPSDGSSEQQSVVEKKGGKTVLSADASELSDDDGELLGVNRSSTWKRQSLALIKEREQHGPALPTIADDDEEEDEDWVSDVRVGGRGTADLGSSAQPPAASAVEEYLDILDFMNATGESSDELHQTSDREEGHISSDLDGNHAATSDSELDLSATDSSESDAESDAQYLARLLQPGVLTAANVTERSLLTTTPAGVSEPGGVDVRNWADSGLAQSPDEAAVTSATRLGGRSTLRRNRRIVSRGGRSARRPSRTAVVKAPQASEETSEYPTTALPSSSEPASAEPAAVELASTHASRFANKEDESPDRVVRKDNGDADNSDSWPRAVGLAKLAEDAIAASSVETRQRGRRIRPSSSRSARHKALPPIPDRVARTMEVADKKAAAKLAPPLPKTERPKIPHALAEDGLATRADIAVGVERPSSTRLFGDGSRSDSSGTAQDLRTWLQRTDMLLPPAKAASKPLPCPPGNPGRSPLLVSSQFSVPEPGAANHHAGAFRNLAKTNSTTAGKPTPHPSSFDAPRPFSANPSLRLSNSCSSNSHPASPSNSNRNSVASAASAPAPTCTTAPEDGNSAGSSQQLLLISGSHSLAKQQKQKHHHQSQPVSAATTDRVTALYTPVTSKDTVVRGATSAPGQPLMSSPATFSSLPQQQPYGNAYADGIYSPLSAIVGSAVLSAPPCTDAATSAVCPEPLHPDGLVEPSAPMLLEPTAPELPNNWSDVSSKSYSFPVPVHYAHSGHSEMGFALSPQVSADQETYCPTAPPLPQQPPPKLPEKPRPYMPDVLEQQLNEKEQEQQEHPVKPLPLPPSLLPLAPSTTYVTVSTFPSVTYTAIAPLPRFFEQTHHTCLCFIACLVA